jgi:RNA polymerase sigma-70 factor (ECF subfamily)
LTDSSSNPAAGSHARDGDPPAAKFKDADLLRRSQAGDMSAFGELVGRYQDRVFNAVFRMCGNRHDAEELCQEVFVKTLEHLGQFRQDSRFYTWVYRIAMNLTISRRRRGRRVKFHSLDAASGGPDGEEEYRPRDLLTDAKSASPEEQAARSDSHEKVLAALAGLESEFRAVVVLRDIEGLNYEEIAEVLRIPNGTVKSRLYRARCMLQEQLQGLV